MTTDVQRDARDKAEKALTAYRRAQIRHRYGQATVADINARREEYKAALDELGELVEASEGAAP